MWLSMSDDQMHVGLGGEVFRPGFFQRLWNGTPISGVFSRGTTLRGAAEDRIRFPADVASLSLQRAIQALHATREAAPDHAHRWEERCEDSQIKALPFTTRRLCSANARRRRTLCGRIDERVKEHRPIALRQYERLLLRNRPPCSVGERGHAEIGERLRCNQSDVVSSGPGFRLEEK